MPLLAPPFAPSRWNREARGAVACADRRCAARAFLRGACPSRGWGWVLLCAALGCQGSELEGLPTQHVWGPDPIVPRGVVARSEHYDLHVSALAECSAERGAANGRRVGVLVTVQARGIQQVPANPYYALLVDGEDEVHEATLGGCTPPLPVSLLEAGQSARGWISFDVPRQRSNFSFSYAPLLANGDREETRFRLSP